MSFVPKEKGQGLVEYALILLALAIIVCGVLAWFGYGPFVGLADPLNSALNGVINFFKSL